MTIENEEISWKPFYVAVEGSNLSATPTRSGKLAPRGGADKWILHVEASELAGDTTCVIVRTESDMWMWRIQ